VRQPLDNEAGEAPGVPAGCQRLDHAKALDARLLLLPFNLRPPIHHASSHLHCGQPRPRHHYVVLLPISTAAGFGQGSCWVRRRLRCDQVNGENAARSARAPLKNGAAVRRSRLKIATDVAGMLGSSKAPAKRAVCSHWREWRLTALSVGPGSAESTIGPIEKMPHRDNTQVRLHTAVHRAH
jgi:hypothetical protein